MSNYEPGTVAVATVRGVPNVRVFRRSSPETGTFDWAYNPDPARGLNYSCDSDAMNVVADVRPLVVLDPYMDLYHDIEGAAELLRASGRFNGTARLLDELSAAKRPRIPEPGLWGVVSDSSGNFWVCNEPGRFTRTHDGVNWPWVDIESPVLVRDGIKDES